MKTLLVNFQNTTLLLLMALLFSTCKDIEPKPIAGFEFFPNTNLVAPVKITFTNTSQNATSFLWKTSDGQTSTSKDITYTVNSGGKYTITLTATGEGGSDTYSQTFVVADAPSLKPIADFAYSPGSNLTAPAKVTFSNTSKNADSYKWDFGDGTTSTATSPTKEFTKAGDFMVKLVATDSKGQTSQKTATVSVKAATSANGQAVFWTDKSSGWSSIGVSVSGVAAGTITTYYTSAPACGSSLTISRPPGTYAYSAKSNTGVTWSGNIIITANGCYKQQLAFSTTPSACDWSIYSNTASLTLEGRLGNACGTDGASVKATNKTNIRLVIYIALEQKDGKWDIGAGFAGPGESFSWGGCKNTGNYKYWAMSSEVFNKNNCPNPKP